MTVAVRAPSTSNVAVHTHGDSGARAIEAGQRPRFVSGVTSLRSLLALTGLLLVLPRPSAAAPSGGWEGRPEETARDNARTRTI